MSVPEGKSLASLGVLQVSLHAEIGINHRQIFSQVDGHVRDTASFWKSQARVIAATSPSSMTQEVFDLAEFLSPIGLRFGAHAAKTHRSRNLYQVESLRHLQRKLKQ